VLFNGLIISPQNITPLTAVWRQSVGASSPDFACNSYSQMQLIEGPCF
jgi:hypothetical protein